MASSEDSRLHWCTEEIPIGSRYFLEFEQSFTESGFLGSLQREGSWIGALPLIRTDVFDVSRLKYLVPTIRYYNITSSDPIIIEKELLKFSEYLLQPHHAFIHLFSNFDFCDQTEYIPLNTNISNHKQYTKPLPLYTGKIINKSLINSISELISNDKLNNLKICEDISRTGIGFRCLYPKQYNSIQNRFIIRATINFQYPGKYIFDENEINILLMDNEWNEYINKIQTKLTNKSLIPTQQEKLWKQLLINKTTQSSSGSDSDSDIDYKMHRVSDTIKSKLKKKKHHSLT
eukprot:246449_1